MAEPQNYIQRIINRVAGLGMGKKAKTLIVTSAPTSQDIHAYMAHLQLGDWVEVRDVTGSDAPLAADPQFHAVLIATDGAHAMIKVGRLCAAYQNAGVPVVVIMGWAPPMDRGQFRIEAADSSFLSGAGMFDLAAAYCKGGIKGDILEFGTFQGFTLQCAYHAFNRRKNADARRFIAFDSFTGIVGTGAGENFADGTYAASEQSFRFSNFLAEVPEERVTAISGPFSLTLGEDALKTRARLGALKAALVHIDCDVQAPAKLALDFVTPYLQQGSLLLFDEYDQHNADNALGERAALAAWLKENPRFDVELYRPYSVRAR